jgi:hypothetical protein
MRGRILIHASKTMTRAEWDQAWWFSHDTGAPLKAAEVDLTFENIQLGGIIGTAEICGCVTESTSPWFVGRYGFLLRDPRPLPFVPYRGRIGFFDVPMVDMPDNVRRILEGQP